MKIAIGTTSTPKVEWIKDAINFSPYFIWEIENIEYILKSVQSNVWDMPLSIDEIMLWAFNRAKNLKKEWIKADYFIWIEWWTTQFWDKKYIWWIVYIENSLWEWHYWFSNFMEVPKIVEKMLYIDKLELGPIMWELSGRINIKSENWSMGAWSDDVFIRKDEFKLAFSWAISPFYNKYYKL